MGWWVVVHGGIRWKWQWLYRVKPMSDQEGVWLHKIEEQGLFGRCLARQNRTERVLNGCVGSSKRVWVGVLSGGCFWGDRQHVGAVSLSFFLGSLQEQEGRNGEGDSDVWVVILGLNCDGSGVEAGWRQFLGSKEREDQGGEVMIGLMVVAW